MSLKSSWGAAFICGLLASSMAPSMASAQPGTSVSAPRPSPVPSPTPPARSPGFAMPPLPSLPALSAMPEWPDIDLALRRAEAAFDRFDLPSFAEASAGKLPPGGDDQQSRRDEQKQRDSERRDRGDESYQRGQELLERSQWARAADQFSQIIGEKISSRIDAALYWKAYALDKLAQQTDALATIAELTRSFPASRWLADARALELQVRQNSGQTPRPDAEPDEDLKLLAIQGLQRSDPEQAVPMLEKFLQGNQSPRLKERALFVLAQSNSARARAVLTQVARGGSNPDVQRKAIQYLGVNGTQENRQVLADIYAAATDVDIKRQILKAFMISGDRTRVVSAAATEKAPELRQEAVRQLGVMGASEELWQLYQKETVVEVKKQILQSMMVGGDATHLVEVANAEQNPDLRGTAVRQLATMGSAKTGDALVSLYAKEKEAPIKRLVINALFVQDNADALVALARKETDAPMKKEIVQKLSLMKSKIALDYLMEILNK